MLKKLVSIVFAVLFFAAADAKIASNLPDFVTVGKKAIPAVVSIQVKSESKLNSIFSDPDSNDDPLGNEFWNQFFGMPYRRHQPRQQSGQASGFIISSDGYIITNSHVVNAASEIKVILNDGRELAGNLIGHDPNTDVALIKVEAGSLPYLKFAQPEDLEVGEWVAAIGSPLGLQATLTTGVISAKGRNNLDLARIEDFIQTDAPINRGNSGGPLLNLDAEVVGMNTAIVTNNSTGGYMGIGFAIPTNIINHIVDQLKQGGKITRGFIGVSLQKVDQDLAAAFEGASAEGALVTSVEKDSPAEKGGIMQGDIILSYNDTKITNIGNFRNVISLMSPGTEIKLSVLRKGLVVPLSVTVQSHPSSTGTSSSKNSKLGFEVEPLTSELARNLRLASDEKGVVISKVLPGSAAEWAGLQKGSLIVGVNQSKVTSIAEFEEALDTTVEGKPTLFLVKQGNIIRYVSIRVN